MKILLLISLLISSTSFAQIIRTGGSVPRGCGTQAPRYNPRTSPCPNCKTAIVTPTGIVLDTAWKQSLNAFAEANVAHPSWGYTHSERNYHLTKKIAADEGFTIDEDIVLAAAFLHDLGGLPGFEVEGVDHAVKSAELAGPLLKSWGFPDEKIEDVKTMIRSHIYYGPKPEDRSAAAFRDADMLDFLGAVGVARLLAANSDLGNDKKILNSVNVIQTMSSKLPAQFSHASAKAEGARRAKEGLAVLKAMEVYSFGGRAF